MCHKMHLPYVTPVTCSYILYDTVNTAAIPSYVARAIARSAINSCARYFLQISSEESRSTFVTKKSLHKNAKKTAVLFIADKY